MSKSLVASNQNDHLNFCYAVYFFSTYPSLCVISDNLRNVILAEYVYKYDE